MLLTDLIYLSQKSLRSNLLRSILTSLGIIIGVSSVITMISIGSGARELSLIHISEHTRPY